MHGKKAMIRSSFDISSNIVLSCLVLSCHIIVFPLNLCKQIYDVVRLIKVVLDVVVLCRNTQFNKLVLKCATLFKKAMHFSYVLCFHAFIVPSKNKATRVGWPSVYTLCSVSPAKQWPRYFQTPGATFVKVL